MPEPITIACPHCDARLKVKDASYAGRKVPCPKCKRTFEVRLPEVPLEISEFVPEPAADPFRDRPAIVAHRGFAKGNRAGSIPQSPGKRSPLVAASIAGSLVLLGLTICVEAWLIHKNPKNPGVPLGGPVAVQRAASPPAAASPAASSPVASAPTASAPASPQTSPSRAAGPRIDAPRKTASSKPDPQGSAAAPFSNGKSIDLAYLPPKADMIVVLRPKALRDTPLVRSFLTSIRWPQPPKGADDDLDIWQIETITMGAAGTSDLLGKQIQRNVEAIRAGANPQVAPEFDWDNVGDTIVTMRAIVPIEASMKRHKPADTLPARHAGKAYYRTPVEIEGAGTQFVGVYFPTPMLMVAGPEISVKAAIERGEQAAPRPDLAFIDADAQFVFAFALQDPDSFARSMREIEPVGDARRKEFIGALERGVKGASFGIKVAGGVALSSNILCRDAASAETIRQGLAGYIQDGKALYSGSKGAIDPIFADLPDLFMNSLVAQRTESIVRVTAEIPDFARDRIVSIPDRWMPEFMAMMRQAFDNRAADLPQARDGGGADASKAAALLPDGPPPLAPGADGPPKEPVSNNGIPEGMKLTARTRWGMYSGTNSLEVVIDLVGGPAAKADLYGMYQVVEFVEPDGRNNRLQFITHYDGPDKAFLRRDKNAPQTEHPTDGIRAVFPFWRPARAIDNIRKFSGSLKLKNVDEPKTVTIRNVSPRIGKSIENSDLKKAGVEPRLVKDGFRMILQLAKGETEQIASAVGLDRKGVPVESLRFSLRPTVKDGKIHQQWELLKELPADAGLRLEVLPKATEFSVPLEFADLPVAPPPDAVRGPRERPAARLPAAAPAGGSYAEQMYKALKRETAPRFTPTGQMEVTGRVTRAERQGDGMTFWVSDDRYPRSVVCSNIDPDKGSIVVGQTVTIRGTASMAAGGSLTLTNCEIVEKK